MADSLKLTEVALDKGFQRRVAFMMIKRSEEVLALQTPNANELALAKLLIADVRSHVEAFCMTLVAGTTAENALDTANYQHTSVTDSTLQTAVNSQFSIYASGVV